MSLRARLEFLVGSLASDVSASRLAKPTFAPQRRPGEIWKQKVFCVLSSQFNADRAAAISDQMVQEVPFFEFLYSIGDIERRCFAFLTNRSVRHRFPKMRARQIALCWFPFLQVHEEYHEYIESFNSEYRARAAIVATFPGIGLKQASMFLRNIGAAKNLAIIDAHILYYLKIRHSWKRPSLTPRYYLEAEDMLTEDAAEHGLDLNTFDTIVWTSARAIKKTQDHV